MIEDRLTRKGVYIGLDHYSPYKYTDKETGLTFYFTSKVYKYKFYDKLVSPDYIAIKNDEINHRLKTKGINCRDLCIILMYKEIETRGFCIEKANGEKLLEDDLKLKLF